MSKKTFNETIESPETQVEETVLDETTEESTEKVEQTRPIWEQTVPAPKKAKIVCQYNVIVRKDPRKDAEVLKVVKNGTSVEILNDLNGFSKVKVDGVVGYIASSFCK